MRTSAKNKWEKIGDIDTNPRKYRPKKERKRIYKPWSITGQVVKSIEKLSPTTARGIFKDLVANRMMSNTDKGLQSVRRVCRELQRHKTIIVDLSVRRFVSQEYGTESLIILNPNAVYQFKEI